MPDPTAAASQGAGLGGAADSVLPAMVPVRVAEYTQFVALLMQEPPAALRAVVAGGNRLALTPAPDA